MKTSDAQECVTKTCTKCGTKRELNEFRKRKLKSGNGYFHIGECRVCEREAKNKYRIEHPEQCKKAVADWKKANPNTNAEHSRKSYAKRRNKCRQTTLRWIAENRSRYLKWLRDYGKRSSEALTDTYVAHTIRILVAQAPKQLIELKRRQIQIHRAIKQQKQILKEISNAK